ncbi:MAG TPA: DUF2235 domain-containing protein [Pseudolabrys sp.]|jgi:uncharacterized protein (DUF2235 family)|nr:DUF2235 domain-containing protein [Pseudolabrys sp.]
MSRNIVLCCDGTANEFTVNRTNVVKLYYALALNDPNRQIAYYHPGLGTMEPAGALTDIGRRTTMLLGKAFGYGLSADIRDAYVYLMNRFESGDRVFLFGFSRGAYTARSVASLLRMYGLLARGNEPLVPYAIRMLRAINKLDERTRGDGKRAHKAKAARNQYFRLASQFRKTFSAHDCRPWFVGVWDTVSSVGWIGNPLKLPYTADNAHIEIGRHAISIDERRALFRPNLWYLRRRPPQSGPKDLKQVWFPGVHSDVGGGYPESESGLAKVALEWMLQEARHAGLIVDPLRMARVLGQVGGGYSQPDPRANMHESLKGLWLLAEFLPKQRYDPALRKNRSRFNLGARRVIPAGSCIHDAAYQRGTQYNARFPVDAVRTWTLPDPGAAVTAHQAS